MGMVLFKHEELVNYLTALQVQKSIYEYVVYDSEVEGSSLAGWINARYQAVRQTPGLVRDRHACRQIQPGLGNSEAG